MHNIKTSHTHTHTHTHTHAHTLAQTQREREREKGPIVLCVINITHDTVENVMVRIRSAFQGPLS